MTSMTNMPNANDTENMFFKIMLAANIVHFEDD